MRTSLLNRQRHYAIVLNDLFDPTPHMESHRLFEFVCALAARAGLNSGDLTLGTNRRPSSMTSEILRCSTCLPTAFQIRGRPAYGWCCL